MSPGEILLLDDDFPRSPAWHAIHRADAEVRWTVSACDSFGSKESAQHLSLVFVRHQSERSNSSHARLALLAKKLVEAAGSERGR